MPKKLLKNEKTLNVNDILKPSKTTNNRLSNIIQKVDTDITKINSIINSNISPKYRVIKYLGEGHHGSLFLAEDAEKKRYILKRINAFENTQTQETNSPSIPGMKIKSGLDPKPNNDKDINTDTKTKREKQLDLELNVLKYLSNNETTREFVNPCLEYKILDKFIYTLFPVFNGYSLNNFKRHLGTLNHKDYYKILFHLIKVVLNGMGNIHKTQVAHQNLNENSILVSSFNSPNEIKCKFTDFGLGCGYINTGIGNVVDVSDYIKSREENPVDEINKLGNCKTELNVPVVISSEIIPELVDVDYLKISQRYDVLCLGMIFLRMLLFFNKLEMDFSDGYNHKFIENIKKVLMDRYLLKYNPKNQYENMFPVLNVSNDIKRDIMEYLKILTKYVFCKTEKRKDCSYILDKLIIYEKYKNDIF